MVDLAHLAVQEVAQETDVLHVVQDVVLTVVVHLHVETAILDVDLINIGGR